MKVLLDECIDQRLAKELPGHSIKAVPQMGWAGIKNGELLLRRGKLLLTIFLSSFFLTSCARDPDSGKLRVTVLDVGQGDSIVVETPSHRTILIDGGGSNDETQIDPHDIGRRTVVSYLHYRGINKIDLLILTHPHADHVGGLPAVLEEEPVGQVLDGTVLPYPTPSYTQFLTEIRNRHIPYQHARRGMHINLRDGVVADVLNPPALGTSYGVWPNNTTMNNYSAVLLVTYGRMRFLLDGDAQEEAEQSMLAAYPNLSADVLKCGHHGSQNATSDSWLDRVRPRYAAISCGLHNHFGHPHAATLRRLAAHGVKVYRTDLDGAITFVSDGQTVSAQAFVK